MAWRVPHLRLLTAGRARQARRSRLYCVVSGCESDAREGSCAPTNHRFASPSPTTPTTHLAPTELPAARSAPTVHELHARCTQQDVPNVIVVHWKEDGLPLPPALPMPNAADHQTIHTDLVGPCSRQLWTSLTEPYQLWFYPSVFHHSRLWSAHLFVGGSYLREHGPPIPRLPPGEDARTAVAAAPVRFLPAFTLILP